jgi:hypothetical protein
MEIVAQQSRDERVLVDHVTGSVASHQAIGVYGKLMENGVSLRDSVFEIQSSRFSLRDSVFEIRSSLIYPPEYLSEYYYNLVS